MEIFVYRPGAEAIEDGHKPEDLPELLADENVVVWVDMESPSPEEEGILSSVFGFHPLTIEDARETRNHPKVEAFPNYLFFIVHGVKNETNSHNFVTKELDGYLGRNFVVTYRLEYFRSIEAVKRQIRSSPFVMARGADYLLHQILDQIVDLYLPVVEDFDEVISTLEERIFKMKTANTGVLEEVMDLKRSVGRLIRISTKQSMVLYRLSHGEFPLIAENHLPFYRDVHDHLQRVSMLAENYRDLINGLMDIHFSVIANRTNEVMKVLAIFSAIMLPLSLIAGIYGMNTQLPDANNPNSFWHILGGMALFSLILITYFWRKGWLFSKEPADEE